MSVASGTGESDLEDCYVYEPEVGVTAKKEYRYEIQSTSDLPDKEIILGTKTWTLSDSTLFASIFVSQVDMYLSGTLKTPCGSFEAKKMEIPGEKIQNSM